MFMVHPERMLPAERVESSALGKVTALSSFLCDVGMRFETSFSAGFGVLSSVSVSLLQ